MSTSEEKYARSVAKTVATQLLAAQGLDSAQRSTLDILSDLLIRYISEVGSQTHLYAEASHRTECNPLDVTLALRNMGHDIPALLSYAQKLEDAPFAQNISQFPLAKSLPPPASFASFNEAPPPHIPAFLPAFPDPHTLLETANFVPTTHDPATRQEELVEQQQLGEGALLRLTAREQPESDALRAAAAGTAPAAVEAAAEAAAEAAINPFLVSTMWDAPEAEAGRSLMSRAGPRGQGPSEVAPIDVEWVVGGREQAQAPGLAFQGFNFTKGVGSRVALGTSGRRAADAYGEDGGLMEEATGRRKKLVTMSEANKNKQERSKAGRLRTAYPQLDTQAKHAADKGENGMAVTLNRRANELRQEYFKASNQCAARIALRINRGKKGFMQVDLHGLYVDEALTKVQLGLDQLPSISPGGVVVRYITGRGQHSGEDGARIKPAVIALLEERGIHHSEAVGYVDAIIEGHAP